MWLPYYITYTRYTGKNACDKFSARVATSDAAVSPG